MLIPHAAVVDLLGGDVDVVDDTPTERRCPCCSGRMRACRIAVDGVDLDHDTLYCKRDGIWLAGGLLEHILFVTGRDSHRDFPGPRGKSHDAPGPFDVEREEQRVKIVTTLERWAQTAWLALGFLLSLGAVVAAGWWCVVFCVVSAIVLRYVMLRRSGSDGELGLLVRRAPATRALIK